MKNNKKTVTRILSLLLCLLLAVSGMLFTSCTKDEEVPADTDATETPDNTDGTSEGETLPEETEKEDTGVIFINATAGNDENDGLSAETPVATIGAAYEKLAASEAEQKTLTVCGELELDVIPACDELVNIVGDGAEGTQIICSANGITLSGPTAFDNINLRITTANKFISTEGHALYMGENVTHDAEQNVSDALNFHIGTYSSNGPRENFTFSTDVNTVFVGSYYNTTITETAGADIVMNGGSCYRIVFGSDGWAGNHLGVVFTDDVNLTYNGGEIQIIARHTDRKAPSFKGALQLVANNGLSFPEIPDMSADKGIFVLSCEAVEGSSLEPVGTGIFKVNGEKTAIAENDNGKFISAGGYLVVPAGTYSVSFTDEIFYSNDGEKIEFPADYAISPEYFYHKNYEDKLFLGWTYEDGSLLDGTNEFKNGDVLKASYVNYTAEDFTMAAPAISYENGEIALKLETIASENISVLNIKERGILAVDTDRLGDSNFTYNFPDAEKFSDGTETATAIFEKALDNPKKIYAAKGYIVYTDLYGVDNVLYTEEHEFKFFEILKARSVAENIPEDEKAAIDATIKEISKTMMENYFAEEKIDIVGTSADKNGWIYQLKDTGIMVREVDIETEKGGEPVRIIQISDLHFNYLNEADFEEANPSILATYAGRKWNANASSVGNAVRCLEFASIADQMVITGDVLDYMSLGAIELMWKHIFTPYPDAIITLGNHEATRRCQDNPPTPDPTTFESRMEILQENWAHDIYYSTKILEDRIMIIQMDDGAASCFWDSQIEPLKADLALAREKGYTVLLFFHIPLCTGNPEDTEVYAIRGNDGNVYDFYNNYIGKEGTEGASKEVYDIITNNADVIKGIFTGHKHGDYYTEILAKTADGQYAVIPQYVLTGTPYDLGHALLITIK